MILYWAALDNEKNGTYQDCPAFILLWIILLADTCALKVMNDTIPGGKTFYD